MSAACRLTEPHPAPPQARTLAQTPEPWQNPSVERVLTYFRCLPILCLTACYSSVSSTQRSANELVLANNGVLCGDRSAVLSVAVSEPAYFLNRGVLEVPVVTLVDSAGTSTDVAAAWTSDNQALEVQVPSGLSDGVYQLQLRRPSDQALIALEAAVSVTAPPRVTRATGQAACASGSAASEFTLFGENLSNAKVTLTGFPQALRSAPNADGTELVVSLPALLPPGGPYDIVVETGVGCTAVFTPGVSIVNTPTISQVQAGPTLLKLDDEGSVVASSTVSRSSTVTVRLTGTNLVAGARVLVGSQEADSVVATTGAPFGTSIDAEFAANRLDEGTQSAQVRIGSCVAAGTAMQIEQPALTINRVSPGLVSSTDEARFVDVFGSLSAVGDRVRFYVDTNPDPIAVNYQAMLHFTWLNSAKSAARAELLSSLPASDRAYDVLAIGSSGESGLGTALIRVSNLATPTIVYKNKTSLIATRNGGDTLSVYGCDLTDASWVLLNDGHEEVTPLPAPSLRTLGSTDPGFQQYRCTHSRFADTRADFSALALPAGLYRLRAKLPAGGSDDLYPLGVYSDAPSVTGATAITETLSIARREARVINPVDASGRRYVVLFAGSDNANAAPTRPGLGLPSSYESSALSPTHELLYADALRWSSDKPINQVSEAGGGGFGSEISQPMTYGAAVASAGPRILVAGGREEGANPDSSDALSHARLVDPTDRPRVASATLQDGGSIPAGDYWIAVSRTFSAFDGDDPLSESLISPPVRVSVTEAQRSIRLMLKTRCGNTTNVVADAGYAKHTIYTAPANTDTLEPPGSAFRQAIAVNQPNDQTPCMARAAMDLGVTLTTLPFIGGNAPPKLQGYLPPLRPVTGVTLVLPSNGASSQVVSAGAINYWVVFGGVGSADRTNLITLNPAGIPVSRAASQFVDVAAPDHAYGSAVSSNLTDGLIVSSGGFVTGDDGDACVTDSSAYSVSSGAQGATQLTEGSTLVSTGVATIGRTLFSLGGAAFNCGNDTVQFSNVINSRRIDLTTPYTASSSVLPIALSSAAAIAAPPYIYLFGGVRADGGDAVDEVAVSKAIVQVTTAP